MTNQENPNPFKIFDDVACLDQHENRCFLCSTIMPSQSKTDEHVIPKWAQRRYDLWNQSITLLNRTCIRYRQLKVPCCESCNNLHLRKVEDAIASTVDQSHKAVQDLDEWIVFAWLGKLYYGLLYRDLSLKANLASGRDESILTGEDLAQYQMHRTFLQRVRDAVEFVDFEPGTLVVLPAQSSATSSQNWDLIDSLNTHSITVRVGKCAFFASFKDGGALRSVVDPLESLDDFPLHPLQFRECAAQFHYLASLTTRNPKYISISGSNSPKIYQLPLGGFSLKPLLEPFDTKEYAQALSALVGIDVSELVGSDNSVVSWIYGPDGKRRFMKFE